jgi:hypothetical protein
MVPIIPAKHNANSNISVAIEMDKIAVIKYKLKAICNASLFEIIPEGIAL